MKLGGDVMHRADYPGGLLELRMGVKTREVQSRTTGKEMKKFAVIGWGQLAQDRGDWKSMGEAFVLQWT